MSILLDKWSKDEIWDLYEKLNEELEFIKNKYENKLIEEEDDAYIELQEYRNENKELKEELQKITKEKNKINIENSELKNKLKIFEDKPKEKIIEEYIDDNLQDDEGVITWGLIRDDYKEWKSDKKYKNKPDVQELKTYLIDKQKVKGWNRAINGAGNNIKLNYKIIKI